MTAFQSATSRYQERELIRASGFVSVGISVGRPRFVLGYTPTFLRELAPYGLLDIEDAEEFDRAHLERLEAVGIATLQQRFAAICAEHEKPGLVLLCFERVGEDCHRHIFRRWWEHKTGQEVAELRGPRLELR